MDEEEVDRSVQIWRNFVNIWKIWYKETGKNLSKMDLTTTEFTVMRHLIHAGPQSMNALANLINVTPGWITGIIDKMEGNGLVLRNRQEGDRRIINIMITDHGKEVFAKAKELHYEFVRKSLEGLSEAEMDEALGLLEKMKISICDTVHG